MALRLVAVQAVDHRGLGYAQGEPILHFLLQVDIELRCEFLLLFRNILFAAGILLEKRTLLPMLVFSASAPQSDVALAEQALAEVQLS